MVRYTKLFLQERVYRRLSPGEFEELIEENADKPIDTQVREWVKETGAIIIHPGQPCIETSWLGDQEDPYKLKCVVIGLVVLYQENMDERPRPIERADPTTGGSW